MSKFIQSLESRRLLSGSPLQAIGATAAEVKLLGDLRTLRADLQHYGPGLTTAVRSLAGDLKQLPDSAKNRTLLSTLRASEKKSMSAFRRDLSTLIHAGAADAQATAIDAFHLLINSSSVSARTKLAADISRLQHLTAGPLNVFSTDISTSQAAITANLNSLAAANPGDSRLNSDTTALRQGANSSLAALQADGRTIQADVSALVANLSG